MPLISVITPVLNALEFLPDMLRSVQDQTLPDWEHILIDDGSTDGSLELMEQGAAPDPRFRLLRTQIRGGPAKARNLGLKYARGRYVAFLDADDLWLPEKLEHCIAWMKRYNYSFIYHDYRHLSGDGKKTGSLITGPDQLDLQSLHTHRGVGCLAVVIDLQQLPNFKFPDDHPSLHEDFLAWLELLRRGHIGHRLAEDLGRYRPQVTSRNRKKFGSAIGIWHTYRNESKLPFGLALNWWMQYAWRAFWMHLRAAPR
jgi:glycosyltransferase involved in cell wall biosynthesis